MTIFPRQNFVFNFEDRLELRGEKGRVFGYKFAKPSPTFIGDILCDPNSLVFHHKEEQPTFTATITGDVGDAVYSWSIRPSSEVITGVVLTPVGNTCTVDAINASPKQGSLFLQVTVTSATAEDSPRTDIITCKVK